ncbi:MAG: aldehyde dehydrogenase family protein, partial [Mycobacterium sp.]|nr:aldehyde dehydrogenase family protein [Mycobacterium sp.]
MIPTPVHDRLYINGQWTAASGSETIPVENPYTEQVIANIPVGDASDVNRAVTAARDAFPGWAATPIADRVDMIDAIAGRLSDRGDELAAIITSEVGTPITLSRLIQVGLPTMSFSAIRGLVEDIHLEEEVGNSLVVREPLGVVAAIAPWNYPLHQMAAKVAPALAAGCTVVLKPSEITPLSTFALMEIFDEVGLPPGVVNMVTGSLMEIFDEVGLPPGVVNMVTGWGNIIGEAMITNTDVNMVTFTGSEGVGRHIGEVTGRNLVPAALELGGKSACVVLDDADMVMAISAGVSRCMLNSGQTCIAQTRLVVPRSRLAEAEAIAAAVAQAHIMGDPFDMATLNGPLVSALQRDRVREHIRNAMADGARLVAGGPDTPAGLDHGYFVAPTVLSDVT